MIIDLWENLVPNDIRDAFQNLVPYLVHHFRHPGFRSSNTGTNLITNFMFKVREPNIESLVPFTIIFCKHFT